MNLQSLYPEGGLLLRSVGAAAEADQEHICRRLGGVSQLFTVLHGGNGMERLGSRWIWSERRSLRSFSSRAGSICEPDGDRASGLPSHVFRGRHTSSSLDGNRGLRRAGDWRGILLFGVCLQND